MTYAEFETHHPEVLQTINPATLRSWKKRGKVPDSALQGVAEAVATPESVAKPVTVATGQSPYWKGQPIYGLMKDGVVVKPAPKGDPADILEDGYARGYPGDTWIMRVYYRTPQAIAKGSTAEERKFRLQRKGYPVEPLGIPA